MNLQRAFNEARHRTIVQRRDHSVVRDPVCLGGFNVKVGQCDGSAIATFHRPHKTSAHDVRVCSKLVRSR